MAIPTITPLPPAPNRLQASGEFAVAADTFLSALPAFGTESNAAIIYIDGRSVAAEQFASSAGTRASNALDSANAAKQHKLDAESAAEQTGLDRQAVENAVVSGPVVSVNGLSGIVNLDATDVNAALEDMSNVSQADVRTAAAIGTNAVGARTVSSAAPTGGADGDVWYRVA